MYNYVSGELSTAQAECVDYVVKITELEEKLSNAATNLTETATIELQGSPPPPILKAGSFRDVMIEYFQLDLMRVKSIVFWVTNSHKTSEVRSALKHTWLVKEDKTRRRSSRWLMMIVVTDEIAALEREISEQKSSSTKASVSLHDTDLASQLERVTGMLQLLFFFSMF